MLWTNMSCLVRFCTEAELIFLHSALIDNTGGNNMFIAIAATVTLVSMFALHVKHNASF